MPDEVMDFVEHLIQIEENLTPIQFGVLSWHLGSFYWPQPRPAIQAHAISRLLSLQGAALTR